jgi:DNA-directed RNA polymerase subunit M/transcription elongation factor TFIIS
MHTFFENKMTTKQREERINAAVGKYFNNGPKYNEVVYELLFSEDLDTDLDTLNILYRDGVKPLDREFILSTQRLKNVKTRVLENYDLNIRSSTLMEGGVKCRYCSSTDTMYSRRQTRASDEAPTTILFCNACGRRSTSDDGLH